MERQTDVRSATLNAVPHNK